MKQDLVAAICSAPSRRRTPIELMRRFLEATEPGDRVEEEVRAAVLELLRAAEGVDIRSYIACLSRNGDQLSQWRAYGVPRGFSLGFDTATLRQGAYTASGPGATLRTVEYHEDVQRAMFSKIFQSAVAEAGRRGTDGGTVGDFGGMFIANALFLAPAFKHPAFEEEAEVRLHVFGDEAADDLEFRSGAMGLTPYVDIHLAEPGSEAISALREVIVGPQPNQVEAVRAATQLLAHRGYKDVEVRPSAIPLRT